MLHGSLEVSSVKDLSTPLEGLYHRLGILCMACEALDDGEHKHAFSVGVADAQDIVSGMIEAVKLASDTHSLAGADE